MNGVANGAVRSRAEYLTIPNILSASRLLLPFLFFFVSAGWRWPFLAGYILVGSTDYFDGLLARKLDQRTRFGKMLDSIADIPFYVSSAYFMYTLFPQYMKPLDPMITAFFVLFGLSFIVSGVRCGKPIMMHTFLLRMNGVLVYFCIILSHFTDTTWFVALILVVYYAAFAEEILIFIRYGQIDPDTPTIFAHRSK